HTFLLWREEAAGVAAGICRGGVAAAVCYGCEADSRAGIRCRGVGIGVLAGLRRDIGEKAPAFPELVQVLSVAVVVQANCAAAGELATVTRKNRTPAHCLRMRSRLRRQEAQSAYYRQ